MREETGLVRVSATSSHHLLLLLLVLLQTRQTHTETAQSCNPLHRSRVWEGKEWANKRLFLSIKQDIFMVQPSCIFPFRTWKHLRGTCFMTRTNHSSFYSSSPITPPILLMTDLLQSHCKNIGYCWDSIQIFFMVKCDMFNDGWWEMTIIPN